MFVSLCGWRPGELFRSFHRDAAMGAKVAGERRFGLFPVRAGESGVELGLEPLQGGFAAGVEEAAVTDPVKAGRQGVEKETPDKGNAVDPPGFKRLRIPVFDTNDDVAAFDSEDSVVADDASLDVLTEVFYGVLPGARRFNIGDPFDIPKFPKQPGVDQAIVFEAVEKERAQPVGEDLGMNEVVGPFQEEGFSVGVYPDAGHDVMNMGVKTHLLGPALVNAKEAAFGKAGAPGVGEDLGERPGAVLEESGDDPMMAQGDRSEFGGQREGDQKIGNRQHVAQLAVHPIGVAPGAALGAEPVVATVPCEVLVSAFAVIAMPAQRRGAALEDGLEGLSLIDGDFGRVAIPEGLGETLDDLHHRRRATAGVPAAGSDSGHRSENRCHQFINTVDRFLMADRRQVRVDGGRLDVGMPQVLLHLGDRDAGLDQMSGKAVPQSVAGGFFGDPGFFDRRVECVAQALLAHRLGGFSHAPADIGGLSGATADLGKNPARIAVKPPVILELPVNRGAEDRVVVLSALAFAHEELVGRSVDVIDSEVNALPDAQAAGIQKQKRGAVSAQWHAGEDSSNLLWTENDRQALPVFGLDIAKEPALLSEHQPIELLGSGEGLPHRLGRPRLLALHMDEITPQCLLVERSRIGTAMELADQADGPVIILLGGLGKAA